jgi:transposase
VAELLLEFSPSEYLTDAKLSRVKPMTQIPKRVWKTKKNRGRPIKKVVPRFQAERTFAWFQKKYRRLVVRWERIAACFEAFLTIATIHIWIHRLIVG